MDNAFATKHSKQLKKNLELHKQGALRPSEISQLPSEHRWPRNTVTEENPAYQPRESSSGSGTPKHTTTASTSTSKKKGATKHKSSSSFSQNEDIDELGAGIDEVEMEDMTTHRGGFVERPTLEAPPPPPPESGLMKVKYACALLFVCSFVFLTVCVFCTSGVLLRWVFWIVVLCEDARNDVCLCRMSVAPKTGLGAATAKHDPFIEVRVRPP